MWPWIFASKSGFDLHLVHSENHQETDQKVEIVIRSSVQTETECLNLI